MSRNCTCLLRNSFSSLIKSQPLHPKPLQNISNNKFHTTSRCFINPLFFALVKPVTKFVSMMSGRYLGNWWKRLPEAKRHLYRTNVLRNPFYIGIPVLLFTCGGTLYYVSHLQLTPITNRRRFIGLSEEQMKQISEIELKKKLNEMEGKVVKGEFPVYRRVAKVVQTIIDGNQDIEQMKKQMWTIYLIDDETSNAFVMPTGEIFIYTGLLRFISNDHQLAFILTHEMAHALLNHAAEQVSRGGIVDILLLVVVTTIWTLIPLDALALFTQWLCDRFMTVLLHLPYSRKLETEADNVGLTLVSKACFDPRESSAFWRKWNLVAQLQRFEGSSSCEADEGAYAKTQVPEFLSTHPNFETRAKNLDEQMQKSIEMRRQCKCPELRAWQQSADVLVLQTLLDECLAKQAATT